MKRCSELMSLAIFWHITLDVPRLERPSVIFQKLVSDIWSDVRCMKRCSEQMSLAIFWHITLVKLTLWPSKFIHLIALFSQLRIYVLSSFKSKFPSFYLKFWQKCFWTNFSKLELASETIYPSSNFYILLKSDTKIYENLKTVPCPEMSSPCGHCEF